LQKLKSEENVIKELARLPPTLSATYAKIYSRMSEADTSQIAVKALRLLACSQRPLAASAFLTAVCPPPQKAIDSESLLDYCYNLIVKDEALDIFRFAHLSVREYLETLDDYTPTNTHAVAAEICLACITKIRVGAGGRTTAQSFKPAAYAMIEYATIFWPVHCAVSGEKRAVPPLEPPIASFIMQRRVGNAFRSWMEDARALAKSLGGLDPLAAKLRHSFCSPPNPFFLACVFGLDEVVGHSSLPDMARCESGFGGLHLASMYGHEQVVRVLLGKGASADSKDTYGRTPLYYAAENGHSKVIEVLLNQDKDIEITPEILVKAAHAPQTQEKKVLELLLSRDGKIQLSPAVLLAAISESFRDMSVLQICSRMWISALRFCTAVTEAKSILGSNFSYKIWDQNANFTQAAPTKVFIECLFDLQPNIEISQTLFEQATFPHRLEVLNFILDWYELGTFIITSKALQNLASTPDTEALILLLPFYNESQKIPQEVIVAVASSGGLMPLKVLIDYNIDKGYETQIPQEAFEAAAGNRFPEAIKLMEFLRGLNANLQITTEVIVAAASNSNHQQALQLVKYLHTQNPEAEITDAVVKQAITNGNRALLQYLLETFKQLKVTKEFVEIAATSYNTTAVDLVELLLTMNPEVPIDEALLYMVASIASPQVMAALFDRSQGCKPTEGMVLEAARWSDTETVEFLITKPPGLQITDATISKFITFRRLEMFCKEVLGVLCDNAKDFKPTEEIAIAAARSCFGREFLGYLIARYGSVPTTDPVWKAATCDGTGSTIEFLLDQNFTPQDTDNIAASVAVLGLVPVVERLSQAWKEIDAEKVARGGESL
jgi:hypothetical protein